MQFVTAGLYAGVPMLGSGRTGRTGGGVGVDEGVHGMVAFVLDDKEDPDVQEAV